MNTMLDRVEASMMSLSAAEQRVASLVMADPGSFSKLSVTELAARSFVSNPTVVRFCRSLGYKGLKDFKLKLAGSVREGVPFVHHCVCVDDKTDDILAKVIDSTMAAVSNYRIGVNASNVERAVTALLGAYRNNKRIIFFGLGNSGIVAQDAQLKYFQMGIPTTAYVDSHLQSMSAAVLRSGDCAVVISNSGRTREILTICDTANKNGATTIAITSSGSPLALAGHIHLAADHREGYEIYSSMVSRLLHLMIIDILAICVVLRIGMDDLRPSLRQMKSCLLDKRLI